MEDINYLHRTNFAILDCECIQTSSHHQCVRSLYILCKDCFTSMYDEFYACKRYRELETKYKKAFTYCQKHVHLLPYEPPRKSLFCVKAKDVLQDLVRKNKIDIILFKGGTIEQGLCNEVGVSLLNIEIIGAPKVNSHNPRVEILYCIVFVLYCIFLHRYSKMLGATQLRGHNKIDGAHQ